MRCRPRPPPRLFVTRVRQAGRAAGRPRRGRGTSRPGDRPCARRGNGGGGASPRVRGVLPDDGGRAGRRARVLRAHRSRAHGSSVREAAGLGVRATLGARPAGRLRIAGLVRPRSTGARGFRRVVPRAQRSACPIQQSHAPVADGRLRSGSNRTGTTPTGCAPALDRLVQHPSGARVSTPRATLHACDTARRACEVRAPRSGRFCDRGAPSPHRQAPRRRARPDPVRHLWRTQPEPRGRPCRGPGRSPSRSQAPTGRPNGDQPNNASSPTVRPGGS